jgi:hypothetical protein
MAPAAKSGMARRSDFGRGYALLNCFSKKGSARDATIRACFPSALRPGGVYTVVFTPPTRVLT